MCGRSGIVSKPIDARLFELIALAQGDCANPTAREAFGKLYNRHATWLYQRICRTRAYRLLDRREGVKDVVQETFYRAYVGADTFDSRGITDPNRLKALVRGWLGGIANRVIADTLRCSTPDLVEPLHLEAGLTARSIRTPESAPRSNVVKALQKELKKLSPLQQDILGTTELYYKPGETHQRLPNGVVQQLAERHGTSPDNIRQVRYRTMAVLRKKLLPLLEGY